LSNAVINSASKREERGELHAGLWRGNLREGDDLEDPGLEERIILK
jgi:hypothetical protein